MTATSTRSIQITGLGLVTPLGVGAWPTFRGLLDGRRITDRRSELPEDTDATSLVRAIGCVATAQHTATDPTVELAERAAREALDQAGIVSEERIPTYLGTSKGAVLALTHQHAEHRHLAVALGPHGYLDHHLSQRLPIEPRGHHVAACASSLTALDAARRAILRGDCDRALVLTAESAMSPAFIHAYHRLGVLASPNKQAYRETPLAQERGGFTLAELAAAVVLSASDAVTETARTGRGVELLNTATAAEAEHLIHPGESMSALAHIADELFDGRAIDVLHPHAPGTSGHDPRECRVLSAACSESSPLIYANKGALGHGLGASGLVSVVLACMCLRTGRIPPMSWLADPDNPPMEGSQLPLTASPQSCGRTGTHAIFAAGFAGHTAGAVIKG
ncbi:beta-ketoacyl synthase N-terminal-like domain-containing protein [Mucisphaera sp.]|uniref:beta-ketoacyl synthase N-terminal-like domain-containing protein n=1 Tax=Mucisphaera sp. TaxID=2913024 RepID=UPI003D0A2D0F